MSVCASPRLPVFTALTWPFSFSQGTLCPAGRFNDYDSSDPTKHDELQDCSNCSAGRYSLSNRLTCQTCSAGQYVLDAAECVDCEPGRFAMQAMTGSCGPCQSGNFNPRSGATSCRKCPATYDSAEGASNCRCVLLCPCPLSIGLSLIRSRFRLVQPVHSRLHDGQQRYMCQMSRRGRLWPSGLGATLSRYKKRLLSFRRGLHQCVPMFQEAQLYWWQRHRKPALQPKCCWALVRWMQSRILHSGCP